MENYGILEQNLMKNIQEFSEFVVDNFGITNYYDLVDLMIDLHNFKAKMYKRDKKLTMEILNELGSEN